MNVRKLKCLDNFVSDFGSEELIRYEWMGGELGWSLVIEAIIKIN